MFKGEDAGSAIACEMNTLQIFWTPPEICKHKTRARFPFNR